MLTVQNLTHRYGDRLALNKLSFEVKAGEIFGLLGPNGSGKTTLFRILSTLMPMDAGDVLLESESLAQKPEIFRQKLGVVFQAPSLDKKLTVGENLMHQGHLYGLSGETLKRRSDHLLSKFRINDRIGEKVEKLSGGLQRRVEIAKAMLHQPKLLLLDEPSTGLDPGARRELWNFLHQVNQEEGVTILVTTHLMDEAERCNRLLLLDQGNKIELGTPAELKAKVSGTVITLESDKANELHDHLKGRFDVGIIIMQDMLRIEWNHTAGTRTPSEFLGQVMDAFGSEIRSASIAQPNLEDVFIHLTG
ncbi:MAG: ABC transporter ATP-binding protein, partial [Verrucomicrobiota bacterium]